MLIISVPPPPHTQTELLPHCSDVPPLARVVQEDGKLLVQAVLEVRYTTFVTNELCCFTSDNSFFISLSCSPPGHRGWSISEPDGAVCRGALQPEQALLYSAGRVAEGGAAASRLPIVPGHK